MKARLAASEFKRIIDNTKRFIKRDAGNELMSWIYLEIDAEEKIIKATALDGHRISIEYARVNEADESFSCYIRPGIPKVTRADDYAELEVSNNRLYAQVGESIIGYVQPKGQFYNVKKFMANLEGKKKRETVAVNARYMKEALESINSFEGAIKRAEIDIYEARQPIVIRSGRKGERENLKIVLPMNRIE